MSAIPGEIGAGVTFRATVSLPVYPAPEWSVDLILRGPGQIDLASAADGDNHAFHEAAAATKDWVPGHYRFELRASDGVDVVTVETGETRIAPDLAAIGQSHDGRDHAFDNFEVWAVEWDQQVDLGANIWAGEGVTPQTVSIGFAPDIGPGHEANYSDISGGDE